MRESERTIVVVGGGFCGTVLAANLLRAPLHRPTRIVLVEQRPEIGRGVAYQSGSGDCLLNVPASRMSADSRDPSQFVRFAQQRMANVGDGDFLPRRFYGEYLQDLLRSAVQAAPGHIQLERVLGQASRIQTIENRSSLYVEILGQGRLMADDVVLASGDPPPVCPEFARRVEHQPQYCCDPYREGALQADTQTMVVIGTGLTAADTIVMAAALNPKITIHAISRHGLFPAVQGGAHAQATDLMSSIERGPLSVRGLMRKLRSLAADVARRNVDWRDVMTIARGAAPRLWAQLPLAERRRFLRHARVHWDIRRHRLPPTVAARLEALREGKQLHVHAGRVLGIGSEEGRLRVSWRSRGTDITSSQLVDRVANCIGADYRLEQCRDPLLKDLIASGLASLDPLGLGLRTGAHGAILNRAGRPNGRLFYLGPMLRAQHWEAIAVGELRVHAEQLAQSLVAEPRASSAVTSNSLLAQNPNRGAGQPERWR